MSTLINQLEYIVNTLVEIRRCESICKLTKTDNITHKFTVGTNFLIFNSRAKLRPLQMYNYETNLDRTHS